MASSAAAHPRYIRSGRRAIALTLIAAMGLALAIAATTEPSNVDTVEDVAKRFVINLPDWLIIFVVVALTAASLSLLMRIVSRPRRRRKGDEGYELYYEPRRVTPAAVFFLIALALLPLGLSATMFWLSQQMPAGSAGVGGGPGAANTGPLSTPAPPADLHRPEAQLIHSAPASALLGTIAMLTAIAALGFVLSLYFGNRMRPTPGRSLHSAPIKLDAAVADSLDDLRIEPDVRKAIIRCYGRFERALAYVQLPRAPWQTPVEFMHSVLDHIPLPRDAVRELTRLFEISRFSKHPVQSADREAALRSLVAIKMALDDRKASDVSS